ncbi:MAG: efflux RND transporter periplasmic adaptor subunit [Hyphomicrobiaceae bacterium]
MLVNRVGAAWLLLISALAISGCERSQSDVQRPKPPPPTVTVATPLKRMVANEEEQVGRFVAVAAVEIKAKVSGYLSAAHFKDGQIVEKGQKLYTIDKRPFEIAVDQARANLQQSESNLILAESDLARAKDLVMGASITQQTMDQRAAARRSAQASVLAQKAAVRQALLDLEFTELTAPVAGRIGDNRVSVGNFVTAATSANSSILATIQSIDPIRFEFTLDESAFLRLQRRTGVGKAAGAGLSVRLKLIDEKDFGHTGELEFVDNAISRTSGSIRARAKFANPDGLLTPGLFGRILIEMGEPRQALLVPDAAIGSEQVRKVVMVVSDDNIVKPKYVTLGPTVDGLRVVKDGLAVSDRVIIEGLMQARPGMTVTPKAGTFAQAAPGQTSAN